MNLENLLKREDVRKDIMENIFALKPELKSMYDKSIEILEDMESGKSFIVTKSNGFTGYILESYLYTSINKRYSLLAVYLYSENKEKLIGNHLRIFDKDGYLMGDIGGSWDFALWV